MDPNAFIYEPAEKAILGGRKLTTENDYFNLYLTFPLKRVLFFVKVIEENNTNKSIQLWFINLDL